MSRKQFRGPVGSPAAREDDERTHKAERHIQQKGEELARLQAKYEESEKRNKRVARQIARCRKNLKRTRRKYKAARRRMKILEGRIESLVSRNQYRKHSKEYRKGLEEKGFKSDDLPAMMRLTECACTDDARSRAAERGWVKGHRFPPEIIVCAVLLFFHAGCSFRSAAKAIKVFIGVFLPSAGIKAPSHVAIFEWVLRAALHELRVQTTCEEYKGKSYSLIVDESITIAKHKILLVLITGALHPGHPLRHADVKVAYLHVGPSHGKAEVSAALKEVAGKVGTPPKYVVSDGGQTMVSGIREADYRRMPDVSHAFGVIFGNIYGGDQEFDKLYTAVGSTRKHAIGKYGYLCPPNMRAIARNLNHSHWVEWAWEMLNSFMLPKKAQELFKDVLCHQQLICELHELFSVIDRILKIMKGNGINEETYKECRKIVIKELLPYGGKNRTYGEEILKYLKEAMGVLNASGMESANVSSDIIETLFGWYKERKASNKRYGVTPFVVIVALHLKSSTGLSEISADYIKEALETTPYPQVKVWRSQNIGPSPEARRKDALEEEEIKKKSCA